MQQHNQVFVIQVSSGAADNKSPLALPSAGPDPAVLPSEVKYSASLVRGLGLAHLFLGCVIFLLGVLGTWIEPETCWAGAGVWTGLAAVLCGFSGLVAHCFWYKNFSIKAFLVTSVVCVVLSVLAVVLSIYAIVNRHKHFQSLLDQIDEHSWFQPYDLQQEHRLTLNISANLLVGFFLELGLALWSSRVGWRGVQTPEFSASKRDDEPPDQHGVTPLPPRPGQQVPLAALYQLLQAHPEMLGNKSVEAGLVPPWMSGALGDHPTHHSMDYQERVNRFLSHHAIEDQNSCLNRPVSALLSEIRDSSSSTSSGGRCSPADTLPLPPPDQPQRASHRRDTMDREMQERFTSIERKPKKIQTEVQRDTDSERNVKQTHVDKLPNGHSTSERKVKETHVDKLSNGHANNERKVKETHVDKASNRDTSVERNMKETLVDTSTKRETSRDRKVKDKHTETPSKRDASRDRRVKETHTETPSKRETSRDRRVKETHVDILSKRETSRDRKVKETHTETPSKRETSKDRKVRETHTETPSKREASRDRKVKETHVDTLSIGETSSERKVKHKHSDRRPDGHTSSEGKVKETHVDSLSSGDSSSERKKVKKIHVDTLPDRDSSSERKKVKKIHVDTLPERDSSSERKKVKKTHVDTLPERDSSSERKVKETHVDTLRSRRGSEHKPKAPVPKVKTSDSFKSSETLNKGSGNEPLNIKEVAADDKNSKEKVNEVQSKIFPMVDKEEVSNKEEVTNTIIELMDADTQSKKSDKTDKHKKKKSKKSSESTNQDTKTKSSVEEVNGHVSENTDNTDTIKSEREEKKARKEKKEKRRKEKEGKRNDPGSSVDLVTLASSIQPPCEFQDTS